MAQGTAEIRSDFSELCLQGRRVPRSSVCMVHLCSSHQLKYEVQDVSQLAQLKRPRFDDGYVAMCPCLCLSVSGNKKE